MPATDRLLAAIDRLNDHAGALAAWLLLAMVGLMFALVLGRYLFSVNSVALQELALWLHASTFLLGLGYALRHDAHVRVDVFAQRWSRPRRALAELAGCLLLLLPVCVLIVAMSWDYVAASWASLEGSRDSGGLPGWYLLKTLLPLAAVLLGLQALAQGLRAWRVWRNGAAA